LKFHNNGLHYCYQRVMSLPWHGGRYAALHVEHDNSVWHLDFSVVVLIKIGVEILCMVTLVCIIKWKIHMVLRITNGKKKLESVLESFNAKKHDLFACDSNEFSLFGSKVSLEVPVAAQFGLRAVAYISSHQVIEDFAVYQL
ncbi:hypothetical protein T02_12174, partial [Trichinella nativa]